MMRRLGVVLAMLGAVPAIAVGQDPLEQFDLSSLQIPKGFLDLQEFEITGIPGGGLSASARTTLGGNAARVFIAAETGADGKRILTLALRPEDWSLTKAIPALANPVLDNLKLSNVTLVVTGSDVRLPAAMLPDDQYAFYREVYQADNFTLVLKPGINLIAAIPVDRLEPGHPLLGVMDALGIEKGTVLLQGALGSNLAFLGGGGDGGGGGLKDLFLRAELPPMRPPGSPEWFKSGQLALELTGLPSVKLVGEMNVAIKEDELRFFLAASLASSGVSLSGGMVAVEPWVAPFGIDWLTLNKVVLQIGFTSTGAVQLGFAGDAVFGEKDIDVAVAIAITPPGVPTNFIVKGESEAGVGLSDVAKVQQQMMAAREVVAEAAGSAPPEPLINIDALPNIEFRDLGLQFAPMAAPDLGVEQGMKLKGRMWLPLGPGGSLTDFAGVDINVSRDGFWARGDLGAFTLGPLTWQDAALDLTAMPGAQHFMVKGDVQLFGARQKVDVSISKTGLDFHTLSELYGLFRATIDATAAFNLRSPAFQVDAVVDNSFGSYVQPLVRDGVERFARGSAQVVERLANTVTTVDAALAKGAATAAELRRVLETLRSNAERNWNVARTAADQGRASAAAAKRSQDAAYNLWWNTPIREIQLKAARRNEWLRWAAIYAARTAAYTSLQAAAEVNRRIFQALPPVDQNVALLAADAAVTALRGQLQDAQRQLGTVRDRLDNVLAFVATGVDLFTIERGEIHAGLDGLLRGDAVNWKITGTFVGQPYTLERTLNFSEPARAVADMVTGLIEG